jgi:FkbM family methyltransferase
MLKRRILADVLPEGFNELCITRLGPMLYNKNDRYVGRSLARYGEFSSGEAKIFRQIVQPGMVVVEVGANIGAHTVLLSQLAGARGKVHAFEPQRIVFQTLCANLALNQCTNVVAQQVAVAEEAGILRVPYLPPDRVNNFGGLSLQGATSGEEVPKITLDNLALPQCQFIKADVEGMEVMVVAGARETIQRHRPVLYLENDREAHSRELIGLVLSHGYRVWWHVSPLFNPDNFAGETENVFVREASFNLLCCHRDAPAQITGFREVTSPDDKW